MYFSLPTPTPISFISLSLSLLSLTKIKLISNSANHLIIIISFLFLLFFFLEKIYHHFWQISCYCYFLLAMRTKKTSKILLLALFFNFSLYVSTHRFAGLHFYLPLKLILNFFSKRSRIYPNTKTRVLSLESPSSRRSAKSRVNSRVSGEERKI